MRHVLLPVAVLAALSGCLGPDRASQGEGHFVVGDRFGLGLPSELAPRRLEDGAGIRIDHARCVDGCTIVSDGTPVFPHWYVTPTWSTFRVHIEGVTTARDAVSTEVVGYAPKREVGRRSTGAGPGVAVLPGAVWMWSIGTEDRTVDFDGALGKVELEGPFEVLTKGPGLQDFEVVLRARGPGRGRALLTLGTYVEVVDLLCVEEASVRDLALAPTDHKAPFALPSELAARSTQSVRLSVGGTTTFWVAFTTKHGDIGIGGAGDALPAPLAPFAIRALAYDAAFEELPSRRGSIALTGNRVGRSTLALKLGEATATIDVEVQP